MGGTLSFFKIFLTSMITGCASDESLLTEPVLIDQDQEDEAVMQAASCRDDVEDLAWPRTMTCDEYYQCCPRPDGNDRYQLEADGPIYTWDTTCGSHFPKEGWILNSYHDTALESWTGCIRYSSE